MVTATHSVSHSSVESIPARASTWRMDCAPGFSSTPIRCVLKIARVQKFGASTTFIPLAAVHTNVNAATNVAPHLR